MFQSGTRVELRENHVQAVGETDKGRPEGIRFRTMRVDGDRQRNGSRRSGTPVYSRFAGGRHRETAKKLARNALPN